MRVTKSFRFEASHILPKHPGKCSRLHGHSWVLHVSVDGPVNPIDGFVIDYADISAAVKPLIERLDHRHLGQWLTDRDEHPVVNSDLNLQDWVVPGLPTNFYPSSENLLWWIGGELNKPGGVAWAELVLEETCTSKATLHRSEYTHWEVGEHTKKKVRDVLNP